MTIHAPGCGGDDAPWCSSACVTLQVPDPAAALLTASEGADLVGVTVRAVHRWADRGLIVSVVHDDRDRPLFLALELLEAERRTRREPRGRPRAPRRVA